MGTETVKVQMVVRRRSYMSNFTDDNNNDNDTLLTLRHDDGTEVTFVRAPASVFAQTDELEPIVFGLPDNKVYVVFNGELFDEMVEDSIEKNGEQYGTNEAAFLPVTLLLNIGINAVNDYLAEQRGE